MPFDSLERPPPRVSLARACRDGRQALGLTQSAVAARVGVARSYIAGIERGHANPSLDVIIRLARALGLELDLTLRSPVIVGDRRQRDAVHARCSGYVDRRLLGAGWETAREVAIVDGRWRGWIDLLAFDLRTGTLLVIEIKTTIDDLGALERQVGWYERVARRVSLDRGWRPRRIVTWVLVLASEQNELAMTRNRGVFGRAFSVDVALMQALLDDPGSNWPGGRALASIDPGRRRRTWLVRPRMRGGRTASPYRDYRDAAASLAVTSARWVRGGAPQFRRIWHAALHPHRESVTGSYGLAGRSGRPRRHRYRCRRPPGRTGRSAW
jgi:transcriptional regulator with XRE-family HTH domain